MIIQANILTSKIKTCKEENLHVLAKAFRPVYFIKIALERIMNNMNNAEKIHLSNLIDVFNKLYLAIRKRIANIHGLTGYYYYVP
jgi:hypothetical protein